MLYPILRPLAYLQIANMGHKWFYDYCLPIILSLATILIIVSGNNFNIEKIIQENKIGAGIFDIVKSLPGFFIAALAAVATFNRPKLDSEITHDSNNTPKIKLRIVDQNGKKTDRFVGISRRVFLCMMFAYLTAASLILSAAYIIYYSSGFIQSNHEVTFYILNFYFIFQFWQIVVCTLFGLFYLADKIHQ